MPGCCECPMAAGPDRPLACQTFCRQKRRHAPSWTSCSFTTRSHRSSFSWRGRRPWTKCSRRHNCCRAQVIRSSISACCQRLAHCTALAPFHSTPAAPPHPAERLLRHLHASGVPFCLATSSHLRHYSLKTTLHGELFSLFDHRITGGGRRLPRHRRHPLLCKLISALYTPACTSLDAGDQVSNGKPAPDIFLQAASVWQPAPRASCCLVIEDAPTGVQAAKAAGM